MLIDTSLLKVYDLNYKSFIPEHDRIILFSVIALTCLAIEFILFGSLKNLFMIPLSNMKGLVKSSYILSLFSSLIVGAVVVFLILQLFQGKSYSIYISMSIITISYVVAAILVTTLSYLFLSWYKSTRRLTVFLYFFSMLVISINLVLSATISDLRLSDRPTEIKDFIGGSVELSAGRHYVIDNLYKITSILSFFSLWLTTALLMYNYRDKMKIRAVSYWILLSIPLLYYLLISLYQLFLANIMLSFLTEDPVTVSIIITAIMSLSKPIGGFTFAVAFWRISKSVSYERTIKTFMTISGFGILMLFSADQATSQTLAPYPPYGLPTVTILIIAAFLMLIGIYNSASLVSTNTELRKSIYKHAHEPELLRLIGHAEMEKEVQNTVTRLTRDKELVKDANFPLDLDESELKKYLEFVVREVKKGGVE